MLSSLISKLRNTFVRFRRNPLTSRIVRNAGYLLSASTLGAALSMAQSVFAARLLGVETFGILGAVTQFASVINRLTSFRMSELVVSYIGEFSSKEKDRHSAAVFKGASLTEMTCSLLAFGILVALAPLGAKYIAQDPETANIFVLYGLSVVANLFSESALGLLQIYDRFKTIAYITVIQSVVTLGLILAAFFMDGHLLEVVIAYLVGKIIYAGSISFAAFRLANQQWGTGWWRTPLGLLSDRVRDLTRFAISTNLSGTINLVTRDSDILWINALSNPTQGGYYKVAKAFMNVLIIPVNPLISTTYREVAREVAAKHWQNVRYLLRSGTLLSAAWTIPVSIGLAVLGPWLILIYGPEFLPAYPVMLILIIGVIAANLVYWGRSVLLPLGMPDYPTRVGFIAGAFQIAGMLVLVPVWGAIGMATMMSVFYIVQSLILSWKTLRELSRVEQVPVPEPGGG
ncbi:MAG: oligosaccharide flippase family protein [Anaerolineales bacterium]|nr:oligosaccharide flippase family protein [Anaerolineales bacterium]